jgi:hypothetical protein
MIYEIEKDKNNTRLVVGALLRGISSKSREIAREITTRTGREMKVGTVSNILSHISDSRKCDLSRFIRKEKAGKAMAYLLVPEARSLSESHAYGLTLKTGEDRYPLERALGEYPGLRKYVEQEAKTVSSRSTVRVDRTPADAMRPKQLVRLQSAPDKPPADRKMEISFRYSSRYAVSVTASLSTLFLLCSILILTTAAFFTLIYIFFYPFLVIAAITAGLSGAGILIWKATRNRRKT